MSEKHTTEWRRIIICLKDRRQISYFPSSRISVTLILAKKQLFNLYHQGYLRRDSESKKLSLLLAILFMALGY